MPEVLLVAGRDPRDEPGGGHSSYVRAHARAAIRDGYTPHLFCVGSEASVGETDYGVIHREASPARPFRQIRIARHAEPLRRAVERYAEDVTDGDDALLFTPGDPAALADALSRVLGDAPLRTQLAARARATFEARFSPEAFSGSLGAVYREMEGP